MEHNHFKAFAASLFARYETRMWRKEKDAFLQHCKTEFAKLGYNDTEIMVREDKTGGFTSKNLLVGPADADVLITAHYDTPGRSGYFMALNPIGGSVFSMILLGFLLFLLGFLRGFLQNYYFDIAVNLLPLVLVAPMFIKNKHNRTDNTSGVLGVFRMAELAANDPVLREKCAFVLFDHEEIGLVGSRAFAKWRRTHCPGKAQGTVINLDCIGNGDVLSVMTRKDHEGWHEMAAFLQSEGYYVMKGRGSILATSDHAPFAGGISLLFQKRSLLGPLYIPHLHTGKDKTCDLGQIERLCDSLRKYIGERP